MTDEHAAVSYLRDLGREVLALSQQPGQRDKAYDAGRRMGIYEVVTLMLSQAEAFGIAAIDVGLDRVDPEMILNAG